MEKAFILVGGLLVVGVLTVIFGKVILPRLADWIAPSFNKVTDKLADAIMGESDQWESKVREIVETAPEQLRQRVTGIFSQFAKPISTSARPSVSALPPSVRSFFEKYSQLSFDGQTQVLDALAVRTLTHKTWQYAVIGRSEDDGHFYAIDLQDKESVVRLEMDDNGKVFSVEEDAPSFEHFVTLQHELHLKSD